MLGQQTFATSHHLWFSDLWLLYLFLFLLLCLCRLYILCHLFTNLWCFYNTACHQCIVRHLLLNMPCIIISHYYSSKVAHRRLFDFSGHQWKIGHSLLTMCLVLSSVSFIVANWHSQDMLKLLCGTSWTCRNSYWIDVWVNWSYF